MMSMNEIKQEINHFDTEDKLLLDDLSISKDQKQQLDKGYNDFEAGRVKLHDWQDVHSELKTKYK